MDRYVPLLRVLLDSFSAICFTLMAALCLRERSRRRTRWGGAVYTWTALVCAVHFLYRSTRFLFASQLEGPLAALDLCAQFFVPPLLFHLIYASERADLPLRNVWKYCLVVCYLLAIAGSWFAAAGQATGQLRKFALALLCVAALLATVLVACSRRPLDSRLERNQSRWLQVLCGLLGAVGLARLWAEPRWLLVLVGIIPLGFVFVVTYTIERFTFFDILIKKGALAFSALFALTVYFAFLGPRLLHWGAGFAFPLTVWPIVLAYPWFNRRMCAWLDRACLGRRFSPAGAGRHFLSGLQGALSEEELARRAEQLLAEIFQARVEVSLDSSRETAGNEDDVESVRVPLSLQAQSGAEIRLRAGEARFLSEDRALLASLAGTFAFLLENLRLRDSANRLELKALRAQVNPHFLFNALNTIAGLIPRYPGRAEQTIEQLAEVFRFTLRRMDREWVRLEEEIEAVRAYLDVEQARFGDRLNFRIDMSEEAGHTRIPAMIVQTLVENAVKHGIGRQSTPGTIEVTVVLREERISIEVRDTGPGFADARAAGADAGGHGLPNVRDRLRGYFGDGAQLRTGRDVDRRMTLASVEMPRFAAPQVGASR